MNIINLLETININNEKIYDESYFSIKENVSKDSQFEVYQDTLPDNDFNIDIGGNINDFLGSSSILNIQYMFSDLFTEESTVFLTQHDTNIVYVENRTGKIGACISGDDLHVISLNLTDFLEALVIIQDLIINKYNLNPKNINGGYVDGFIIDVKSSLEKAEVINDLDYFIEFFYEWNWIRNKFSKI